MKRNINAIEFIIEAGKEIDAYLSKMVEAISNNDGVTLKAVGNAALGFINGLTIAMNAMICFENNEFTGDFGEWLEVKEARVRELGSIAKYLTA